MDPIRPRGVSLWDLMALGYIPEDCVSDQGQVPADVLVRAEASFWQDKLTVAERAVPARAPRPPLRDTADTPRLQDGEEPLSERCCVCLSRARTHAFAPCFHMCVCRRCSVRVASCPICREDVAGRHRIYT